MKIEALNCPNCGAGALSDYNRCTFCQSGLKTMACPVCLGLMFIGSQHCSFCGAKTVPAEVSEKERSGDCPRCKIKLNLLKIEEISLLECMKCGGFWSDAETFENICAEKESQANVLFFVENKQFNKQTMAINYVPCPDCQQLMNRNNFAKSSGVILDICKQHGVWFDAEELPKIIEFIRQGGLDRSRQKEILLLQEQKRELADNQRKLSLENRRFQQSSPVWDESYSLSIRGFVKLLFD
jgi:Zn-finger nucleic acid-binding protein